MLSLVTQDTTVSGRGTYAIEAGRSGTLTVSGRVTVSLITLDLAYDIGTSAHFEGTISGSDTLSGALKYGPAESMMPVLTVRFRRIQ